MDDRVGGLQLLVRIYNRSRALTWCQDVEFSIFGLLYQAGRTLYGAAAMGGNGQFNRLSALDEIADEDVGGPWRARLTEDQDLGLHLIEAGWRSVADARTSVDQQGLPGFRNLLRQRTRWAQGNLQAMKHIGTMARAPPSNPCTRRPDRLSAATGVPSARRGRVRRQYFPGDLRRRRLLGARGWWVLLFFFLLGYGGILLGCVARSPHRGARNPAQRTDRAGVRRVLMAALAGSRSRSGASGHRATRVDEDCARADRRRDALASAPSGRPVERSRHVHLGDRDARRSQSASRVCAACAEGYAARTKRSTTRRRQNVPCCPKAEPQSVQARAHVLARSEGTHPRERVSRAGAWCEGGCTRTTGARLPRAHARAHEAEVPTARERGANGAYLGRAALSQLSEREGECRDASGEHDESKCRDASRNQPKPSRSELPSQSE